MTSLVLTLVARREATSLTPATIALARDAVSATGETVTLSAGEAVDIPSPATAWDSLPALRAELDTQAVDAILTPAQNRRKTLLVSDMDSTIVANETLDDIGVHAGLGDKIAAITTRSMNGELDFAASLRERVALLQGLPTSLLEKAWRDVTLNPGAVELVRTMRAHGARTALVSGGFTFFTARVAALCGFDENHANTLLTDAAGTTLTGQTGQPILGPDAKLHLLETLARSQAGLSAAPLPPHRTSPEGTIGAAAPASKLTGTWAGTLAGTLAIGDGANDLPMLRKAGLGLAFHAKPVVKRDIMAQINHTSLRTALFAQGYPASAFVSG
ncbi:HAD-IB family phosphatase [Acetobacter sp. TBRC 12305]|uniref:phosphoserine phosphatase n=1 Tax=Acetobacter garciniae TaxID=2817435 RepID=A0A939HL27_9PROT|nr:HAD-IB family phosphatase [Acetobacter garciniae]MBO1326390.1 HAD-IB family phosphatase [Acetobacter garciniae]MBX0346155.1 HAD-IB family phosphatase [Acetobacter garciniae]